MSIRELIQTAVNVGWLVNLQPRLPSIPHQRIILVCRNLNDELERELNDPSTAVRTAELFNTFDTFLGGRMITVGTRNDRDAYMKILEPEADEVWEIRSVDPKPSIRVFGRFARQDVFVATNKGMRTELGGFGSKEFRDCMTRCTTEWRKCFQTWRPHTGSRINDYISDNVLDLRDL